MAAFRLTVLAATTFALTAVATWAASAAPKPAQFSLGSPVVFSTDPNDLIPPSCPEFPSRNVPGALCEGFDTNRNAIPGIQFTRLPVGIDPLDPLRAIGDPNDDILGYTMDTGSSPGGTDARICADDTGGYEGCQGPVAEENDWHLHSPYEIPGAPYCITPGCGAPDGGKARTGFRSMHMGRHLDPTTTLGDTVRLRQVSAFVLDSQGDPSLPGVVFGTASTLEFWQIISFPDDENFGFGLLESSFGGGQVQLSLLGSDGRFEKWRVLTPGFNGYDSHIDDTVSLCGFDPSDDQLPPGDETMCNANPLWADMGDIFGTDATCVTDTDDNDSRHRDCGARTCTPGPGCTENGAIGTGVWTRSAFDLSPYAGRVARLRWIAMVEGGWSFGTQRSALEPHPGGVAYQYFDGDDGWWVDDIALTGLRKEPCDGADLDGDGLSVCQDDCNDASPGSWQPPGTVILSVSYDRTTGVTTFTWDPPVPPGGTQVLYDVLESSLPGDFGSASCLQSDVASTDFDDPSILPAPGLIYYLVRAQNDCPGTSTGSIGAASDGTPRTGRDCVP